MSFKYTFKVQFGILEEITQQRHEAQIFRDAPTVMAIQPTPPNVAPQEIRV